MVPPPPSSRDAFLPPHIIQQHTRAMRAMGLSHRHAQIKSLSTHLPHGEYQSNLPVPHNSRACDETNGGAAASCRCSVRLLAQRADRIKGMVVGGESAGVGRGSHCLRGGSWSSGPPCECPLAPPPTCRLPLEAACTCPRSIPRIHRGGTPAAGVAPFSLRIWAKQSRLLTSNRAHDGREAAPSSTRGLQNFVHASRSVHQGHSWCRGHPLRTRGQAGRQAQRKQHRPPGPNEAGHICLPRARKTHAQPSSACPKLSRQRNWPRKWLVVSAPAPLHGFLPTPAPRLLECPPRHTAPEGPPASSRPGWRQKSPTTCRAERVEAMARTGGKRPLPAGTPS